MTTEVSGQRQKNTLGLIALIISVLGLILAVIPNTLFVGWIVLPIGFILALTALFLKNKAKVLALTAVIVALVGAVISVWVFTVLLTGAIDKDIEDSATTPTPVESPTDDGGVATELGSLDSPLPVGSAAVGEKWEIIINGVDLAANAAVAENQYSDAPSEGNVYIIVDVTANYLGDEPEGEVPHYRVDFWDTEGNMHQRNYGYVATPPNPVDLGEKILPGGSQTGDYAIQVPLKDLEKGVLEVSPDTIEGKTYIAVE